MKQASKILTGLLAGCLVVFALIGSAMAQSAHPVEGKYDVSATGEAIGTITFQLVLKKEGDKWKGEVLNSPQALTVTKVMVDADNKLNVTADAGGAEVTMTAKYADGKINGNWTAGDATGTWTGTKLGATSAAAAGGAAASNDSVEGTYAAEVVADGQGALPFTLIVKKDGDKLVAEAKDGGDLNIVGIQVNGEEVKLNATFQGNPFDLPGKRTGKDMGGKWEAGGFTGTWSAKKK